MIGAEYITCYDGKWDGPVPRCAPSALCERIHANRNGVQNVFYKNLYVVYFAAVEHVVNNDVALMRSFGFSSASDVARMQDRELKLF